MPIRLTCTTCDRPFQLADSNAGQKLLCHCGGTIPVPPAGTKVSPRTKWAGGTVKQPWKKEKDEDEDDDENESWDWWSTAKKTVGAVTSLAIMIIVGGWLWSTVMQTGNSSRAGTNTIQDQFRGGMGR